MQHTEESLAGKSNKELTQIFNDIPGTVPIARFSSPEVGIRRIVAVANAAKPSVEIATIPVGQLVPRPEPAKKRGRKRAERGIYNEPLGPEIRKARPSSGRGRLLELCILGRTFEQLQAELPQWSADQLHRHIRNMHFYLGYRLITTDDGVIFASAT